MNNPTHHLASMRVAAFTALVLVVALTAIRGCHAVRSGFNWKGPLAAFEAERRVYWSER